ncbi:IscS subfamily cysteine desulfurase [secondary endosymbiont of Ctenarytaina eucalypti]|uniref:cysteine desulfurase n=1 Tax=secondary endosymbiont of Ctenarytaina eucalypti TaxID=1199245 RepID=J3TY14_9ENTR|nr:IscS subfamily cysteine desulfurase [secondary endosymbiont of Ctenarytaina eucalypti]AFP85210.1 cysteine desulfurase family protein [secondary endosymbiont of Ctenarytaina eucalypti]
MKLPIYFDYSATTPVDPRVAKQMMHHLTMSGIFGNPASLSHQYGWQAAEAVDIARNHVATLVGADPREIIFTSGATESDNLALKGAAYANAAKGRHIITAVTEHKAVVDTCKKLEKEGFIVTWLVPEVNGIVTPQQLSNALRDETILVSLMHVNNETGVIQDIAALGALCRRACGALFHVDAAQSVGKLPIDLSMLPVDLMSFSAHKVYGPKGIGALFVRQKPWVRIEAQIHGGGHERCMRSGTLPVHQIVGMGEAYHLADQVLASEMSRLRALRDRLWKGLQKIGSVSVNGDLQQIVSTVLNVSFHDIAAESLMMELQNLAISTGSACTSGNLEPSYVLRAMGLDTALARSSIRFSLGRFSTRKEVEYAINQTRTAIARLQEIPPRRTAGNSMSGMLR